MAQPQRSEFARTTSDKLHELCRGGCTGTLYIATTGSLLVQFGLCDGEITFLSVQNKQGLEAVEALDSLLKQDIRIGTTRFSEGHVPTSRAALPSTRYLLERLGGETARAPDMQDPRSVRMTENAKTVVEQELVEFIGPMGAILCEEVWFSSGGLDTVLDLLGRELADPDQAARFRHNVLKRLL